MTAENKKTIFTMVSSAMISIATVIISFGLYATRDENKINDQKLDQKLDKVEFKEECKRTDDRIKKIENTYDLLVEIRNNQESQKTDIEWIKKTLDKN
jgi:hypothetical protein